MCQSSQSPLTANTWVGGNRDAIWSRRRLISCLVCNDVTNATPRLFLYGLDAMCQNELFQMRMSSRVTCITASKDNRSVLISLEEGLVQMIDLEERCMVKRYVSLEQDKHIIRNCFGGAAENFVLSGSKGQ